MNALCLTGHNQAKKDPMTLIDILIKKKDNNFLYFIKRIFQQDQRIRLKAQNTGLDKVTIHQSYVRTGRSYLASKPIQEDFSLREESKLGVTEEELSLDPPNVVEAPI